MSGGGWAKKTSFTYYPPLLPRHFSFIYMGSRRNAREFATRLAIGALSHVAELDERIRSRAEHWRISRMAVVDRNILRLAVYEFLHELTPRTVAINEALEIARRFSTYEATQFINGILDAIKRDLDEEFPQEDAAAVPHPDELQPGQPAPH